MRRRVSWSSPRSIGKPHPQHAGAQREIARVTGGQIGRIGQRHQKISASNCWCRHSLPRGIKANDDGPAYAQLRSTSICERRPFYRSPTDAIGALNGAAVIGGIADTTPMKRRGRV